MGPKREEGEIRETVLEEVFRVLEERRREMPEGSYSASLFRGGTRRILDKVEEEAAELIVAAEEGERGPILAEAADLLFHVLVLLADQGFRYQDLEGEFRRRRR
jgi:phosphoribosyl-ATP pyrophosphohydrolase